MEDQIDRVLDGIEHAADKIAEAAPPLAQKAQEIGMAGFEVMCKVAFVESLVYALTGILMIGISLLFAKKFWNDPDNNSYDLEGRRIFLCFVVAVASFVGGAMILCNATGIFVPEYVAAMRLWEMVK